MALRRIVVVAVVALGCSRERSVDVGPEPPPRASATSGALQRVELEGIWRISILINPAAREPTDPPRLVFSRGDAGADFAVRWLGEGLSGGEGRAAREGERVVLFEPGGERFSCGPDGPASMLCDNGVPLGSSGRVNPKHRSFGLTRVCPRDGSGTDRGPCAR